MSNSRGSEIIGLIQENTQISMREMSIKLNVNIKTVKRDLQKLKKAGLLKRIGPDKGGHWKVIEK
jgi:ATP-dependent DNA helicase RecG